MNSDFNAASHCRIWACEVAHRARCSDLPLRPSVEGMTTNVAHAHSASVDDLSACLRMDADEVFVAMPLTDRID